MIGEKLEIRLRDSDAFNDDDVAPLLTIPAYDGKLIPITLDKNIKGKAGKHGELYVKVTAPKIIAINEGEKLGKVDVQDIKEIYSAQIGSEDGKEKHFLVDYDEISWFYAHTRGIKTDENLYLEIRDSVFGKDPLLLIGKNIKVDESGVIKVKINWALIKNKASFLTVYAIVKENNADGKVLYDADGSFSMATAKLMKSSSLVKEAGYRSAVMVEGGNIENKKDNEKGICECEARVRAFMRMLRKGEGTQKVDGYTKQFGGGHFKNMSTHPQEIIHRGNYYSSAAGAYQIMGYTYYWLNGEKLTDKNKRAGIYESQHDYIKKYKIPDYSAESQDRLCIIILKHKRAGIIELITKNKIKEALEEYGSHEWASLPPGRYGQPTQSMDGALQEYERCLKEELAGKSDLFIKKGFLKEFGYDCCDETANSSDCSCGKKHIDLRAVVKWQTQFDSKWGDKKAQNSACKKTCDDILINSGLSATSLSKLYQTAIENDKHTKLIIDVDISKEGIKYLDSELDKNHPVQVGVDHDLNYKINNNSDHSTDHFIIIIGRGCENNKPYYLFYDVGTGYENKGSSDNNKLYLDKLDYSLKGTTVYNNNFYTVTQIRKN